MTLLFTEYDVARNSHVLLCNFSITRSTSYTIYSKQSATFLYSVSFKNQYAAAVYVRTMLSSHVYEDYDDSLFHSLCSSPAVRCRTGEREVPGSNSARCIFFCAIFSFLWVVR